MSLSDASLRKLTAHLEQTGSPEGFVPVKRKARNNDEWKLQASVFAWWRTAAHGFGLDPRLYVAIPNGALLGGSERDRQIRGKMLKMAGMENGFPDTMLLLPRTGSWSLLIEYKTPIGVLSPEQKALHPVLRLAGFRVEVIRSFEEAVRTITEYIKSP